MTRLSTVRSPQSPVRGCAADDSTADCGLWIKSFDRQNLLDDFVGRQIAFPALKAAGAEFAAVGAADLGGDAERMTVARFAIERGIGRNQNAFD